MAIQQRMRCLLDVFFLLPRLIARHHCTFTTLVCSNCGACMFNRMQMLDRVAQAKRQQVPMTNYGVAVAHLLDR